MVLLVTLCIKIRFTVSLGHQISITKSQRIHYLFFFSFLGKIWIDVFFSIGIDFLVNKTLANDQTIISSHLNLLLKHLSIIKAVQRSSIFFSNSLNTQQRYNKYLNSLEFSGPRYDSKGSSFSTLGATLSQKEKIWVPNLP